MVYEDAEQYYAEVREGGKKLIDDALGSLLHPQSNPVFANTPLLASGPGSLVAVNTTMFPRLDVVEVPLTGSGGARLKNVVVQTADDGKTGFALMQAPGGFGLASSRGLLADCSAASGKSLDLSEKISALISFVIQSSLEAMVILSCETLLLN